MRHGSLFSGIGGFDLAAEWMGWENVFHCEINPFCQQILKYHFPDAETLTDIKETDFTIYRGKIDILSGGFPCQPFSLAGKRKGKEDDRHLWPEMLRAIREIQPGWIVGENVFGIVNWSGGMVFDEVQTSLEAEGYEVQPFILPACGVNAPHRRDRVWFVAYNNECSKRSPGTSRSIEENRSKNNDEPEHGRKQAEQHNRSHELLQPFTNTNGNDDTGRLEHRRYRSEEKRSEGKNEQQERWKENRKRIRLELGTGSENVTNWLELPFQSGEMRA
jgi:DNA (cytosine-5)-methyltransferase 1